jgi:predicted dehydrogenase
MNSSTDVRLITLDPAHFHAALVQKAMLPGVAKRVAVYAPLGADLFEHLKRIERFNTRADNPTEWELDIHATPCPVERMRSERPGNVVVLAGRNSDKIGKVRASLDAGLNVLADKPWIINARNLDALISSLELADRTGLVAYDMMTERYEVTSILQKELVNDPAVFGAPVAGSEDEPGVYMESVHHIMKTVAGVAGLRPAFFFDVQEQGEALADVGTHLVDLIPWTLFPEQAIRCPEEIEIGGATRWPTPLTVSQFQQVTGLAGFPAGLEPYVAGGRLDYPCNNQVRYRIRGIHVRLDVLWNWESPAGVDLHHAAYRGSNSRIEVRQGEKENFRPEVYVVPEAGKRAAVTEALRDRIGRLQAAWPGVACESTGEDLRITIPERYRVGHEAHFAQVLAQFLEYLKSPQSMPAWERPNMIAKYYVATAGTRQP